MDSLDVDPQDATERLRARLAGQPIRLTPPPRRAVVPWIVAAMLLTFALGLIANPWFERSVRSQIPGFDAVDGAVPDLAAERAAVAALDSRVRALEARPAQRLVAAAPGTGANERVAAAEARIDGIDRTATANTARIDALTGGVAALTGRVDATAGQTVLTLQAARVDADRAQGALAVLAARRAIERGSWSPGLAMPLRNLFTQRAGPAVEAVIALGTAPVTPASLRTGLTQLRSRPAAADRNWWQSFTASLANVVQVRDRAGTPADPVADADRALAAGDVGRALATLERLPLAGNGSAVAWVQAARRYQAGLRGLSALEEAALAQVAAPTLPLATPQ